MTENIEINQQLFINIDYNIYLSGQISTNAIDFKNNVYEIVINKYINKTILAGPFIKNNKIKPKINNTLNTKTIWKNFILQLAKGLDFFRGWKISFFRSNQSFKT